MSNTVPSVAIDPEANEKRLTEMSRILESCESPGDNMSEDAKSWKQVPWLQIGAEAIAIIASILIAFALDAWWDRQIETRDVREGLAAVLLDFEETSARLDTAAAIRGNRLESAEELLSLTGPAAVVRDEERAAVLIRQLTQGYTLTPVTGAIRALLEAGALSHIKEDSLRFELASWDEQLRDYSEDEVWNAQEIMTRLRPFLDSRLPNFEVPGEAETFPSDYQSLLRDVEFANLVNTRIRRLRQLLVETDLLQGKIERVIQLIGESY